MNGDRLKLLYADILRGYSPAFLGNKLVYFKHTTHYESANQDIKYSFFLEKAIKDSLPTYEQRKNYLIEEKSWSKAGEDSISKLESNIKNLQQSKSQKFLDKDRDELQKKIDSDQRELNHLLFERESMIGFVAEKYASKRANEHYIFSVIYENVENKKRLYSAEEFDELNSQEIDNIVVLYNGVIEGFDPKNIKKISLFPPFFNLFSLCDNNIFNFYGKPMLELTFYQTEIFSSAKNFRTILSNSKTPPPPSVLEDPDKLIEWFETGQAAQKQMSKLQKDEEVIGGSSLVGAKTSDYEKLGIANGENVVSLSEELKKHGGTMNMKDFLKIHGVKAK